MRLGQTIGLPCAARLQQPASDVGPKISIEDAPTTFKSVCVAAFWVPGGKKKLQQSDRQDTNGM